MCLFGLHNSRLKAYARFVHLKGIELKPEPNLGALLRRIDALTVMNETRIHPTNLHRDP
jgi:hypothetical protein